MTVRSTAIEIASLSGRVTVRAGDTPVPVLTKGSGHIDADGVVHTRGHTSVEVECPRGADVVIGAGSGGVRCHGELGRVAVTTSSGTVSIEHAASADVRTASSSVNVETCLGTCEVVTKSGTVKVGRASSVVATVTSGRVDVDATRDAAVHCVSGSVRVGATGDGTVKIKAISGSVRVELATGARPAMNLRSTSGRIRRENEPSLGPPTGLLEVESTSGSITVRFR